MGEPLRSRYVIVSRQPPPLLEPVPGELSRTPIPDATEACESCGGRSWLRVERRAEPEQPFTRWRATVCAACGANRGWHAGGRTRPGRGAERFGPLDRPRPGGLPERPTLAQVVAAAGFTVYAPGPDVVRRSHGGTGVAVHHVKVAGDGVEVETGVRDQVVHHLKAEPTPPERRARGILASELRDSRAIYAEGLSREATELRLEADRRRAADRASRAPARELPGRLAGVPATFTLVESDGRWVACTHSGDHYVAVIGQAPAPAEIALIAYPG